jgi:putative hemolysin
MRCRFTLRDPDAGMSGGGLGQCQLPDGSIIDAQFPRA